MTDQSSFIKVLVVDDSAFARYIITKHIGYDESINVIGTSHDGYDAIKKTQELKPDVITLDIEMPHLNGLEALKHIMSKSPTPVIMLSSHTSEEAEATIKALELGAADFVLKPSLISSSNREIVFKQLIKRIKNVAGINVNTLLQSIARKNERENFTADAIKRPLKAIDNDFLKVVIIGSSTGGPRSLYQIIPTIPDDIPAAILIVQHMPPKFTSTMAERLNELSQITVKEAQTGDDIVTGQALIAPGGYHMKVGKNKKIVLTDDKPITGLRPAIDITMETAVNVFGRQCIGVILTGMGHDGTQGSALIKAAGGTIIAQDEVSCIVYGMPRSVIENGLADRVVPLNEIVKEITVNCSLCKVPVA